MPAKYPYQVGEEPVPGYRVVKFLGKGNFGEVWQAKAPGGANVALKVIPDLSGKQAHKEFRALGLIKDLHHPNLVSINAVWLKDGDGSILDDSMASNSNLPAGFAGPSPLQSTMVASPLTHNPALCELIIAMGLGHKSLYNRLQECQAEGLTGIPTDELLDYMEESAKAIDYLNNDSYESGVKRAGVQHCDIKPHNILIAGTSAQVCDFGLARVQGEVRATATLGATVAYAAPECLEKSGDPSPATDQYSLAITYYELRTGLLPYADDSLYQVMQAILAGHLDLSHVSPAEEAVLRQATSRDPSQRFASTLGMVKALRRAVEGSSGVAAAGGSPASSWPQRVVLAAALVAGLAGLVWWGGSRPPKPDAAVATATSTAPQADQSPPPAVAPMDVIPPANTPPASVTADEGPKEDRVPGDRVAGLLREAQDLVSQGETQAAISKFGLVLDSAPDNAEAHFSRGMEYQKVDQLDDAIADFKKAVSLDTKNAIGFEQRPEVAEAYLARGARFRDQEKYPEAIQDFTEVIRLAPSNALAYSRRGYAHLMLKEFDEAQKDLKQAISLEPDDIDRLNLSIAHSADGKLDEAIAGFTALVVKDPANADALFQRGLAYRDQTDYPAAIADFRGSVRLDKTADKLASLATLLACSPETTNENWQEAEELAREALSLAGPPRHMQLDALAAALARLGKFPDAVESEKDAVELAKGSLLEDAYRTRLDLFNSQQAFVLPSAAPPK